MPLIRKHATLIAFLMLAFFGVLSLKLAADDSAVFDERAHISAGYSYLRYGDIRLNPEHPPILKDLAAFPLLFLHLGFPDQSAVWQNGINEQWEVGSLFLDCTNPQLLCNNTDQILFWSRLPLILVAIALGGFLFFWTRKLSGPFGALLALTFFVTDPNMIAHAHLVTTDVGIAAFFLFSFYFFLEFLKKPSWKNTFLFALFFSLVQLVKFSAVILFPIFGFFVLLYALACDLPKGSRSRLLFFLDYVGKLLAVLVFFALFAWILYFFHTKNIPVGKLPAIADMMFRHEGIALQAAHLIRAMDANAWLQPWSAYLLGVFMVFGRVVGGNDFYFLGSTQVVAQKDYFPVIFLTKESLAFLFLLAVTTLSSLWYMLARFTRDTRQKIALSDQLKRLIVSKIDTVLLVFFILFYVLISVFGNLNIGIRHLFPILPFFYILVAKSIVCLVKNPRFSAMTKQVLGLLVGALILYQVTLPFTAYPYFLSYFNALGGGIQNGYWVATDSNYDWGQDLERLNTLVTKHNACLTNDTTDMSGCTNALPSYPKIENLRVDYFGGGNPGRVLSVPIENWWAERQPEPGWYAISVNTLTETWASTNDQYDWLKHFQPVARGGASIFVYYIPPVPGS